MNHQIQLSPSFSLQLESLRGISALVVLFSHCFQAFIAPIDQSIYPIIRLLGQAAVMVFFVLSGYLIGLSIQKNTQKNSSFNLPQYIQQRCKRILPPFIFSIALMSVLYWIVPYVFYSGTHEILPRFGMMIVQSYDINQIDFIGSIFFLNGFLSNTVTANLPLWSLSYEVWFYVLAGFFPLLMQKKYIPIFIVLLSILTILEFQFLIYFLVWLLAFSFSYADVRERISIQSLNNIKYVALISAFMVMSWDMYQFHLIYFTSKYTTENFTLFNLLVGIGISCWLIELQRLQSRFKPVLASTARYSYTLYITHFPILIFLLGIFPESYSNGLSIAILSSLLTMLICIFFSTFVAKYLEPNVIKSST